MMSDETDDNEKAAVSDPATCYAVGDRVLMKRTLTFAASDELPAQHFCDKGEVLIVRQVTDERRARNGVWPIYVSHEHITDRSFGVMLDEIESAERKVDRDADQENAMKKRATTKSRKTSSSPVERIVRLSSDQLLVLQHAAEFLIASHKRLHWEMVALMGREHREMSEQLKMTARLSGEVAKIEDAVKAINRVFESQFD